MRSNNSKADDNFEANIGRNFKNEGRAEFEDDDLFDLDHKIERLWPRCNFEVESEIGVNSMVCTKWGFKFWTKWSSKFGTWMWRFTTSIKVKQGSAFEAAFEKKVNRQPTEQENGYDYTG